jgi:hypothetical protein
MIKLVPLQYQNNDIDFEMSINNLLKKATLIYDKIGTCCTLGISRIILR